MIKELELSAPPPDPAEEVEIVFNLQWSMIESIMPIIIKAPQKSLKYGFEELPGW